MSPSKRHSTQHDPGRRGPRLARHPRLNPDIVRDASGAFITDDPGQLISMLAASGYALPVTYR